MDAPQSVSWYELEGQVSAHVASHSNWLVDETDLFKHSQYGLHISPRAADFFRSTNAVELRTFLVAKASKRASATAEHFNRWRQWGKRTEYFAGTVALGSLGVTAYHMILHSGPAPVLVATEIAGWTTAIVSAVVAAGSDWYGRRGVRACEYEATRAVCMDYTPAQLAPVADQFEQLHPPIGRTLCCNKPEYRESVHSVVRAMLAEQTRYISGNHVALQIQQSNRGDEGDGDETD